MGISVSGVNPSLNDLIASAQASVTDDSAAMAIILERFEDTALAIARHLTSDSSLRQDAAQGARLGLVRAVRTHKAGTPGFPSYAKRYMKGAALRTLMAMQAPESAVDPMTYAWPDQPRDAATNSTFELVDLMKVMTSEQQDVARAHYLADLSFTEIAVQLNISKPAVTQRFATIHRALRTVMEGARAA
ncbi:MAG: hypothetical protein CVT62_13190 [Actinobacteria bacterium HGW-Actinobacteria-2]|nr:MAG: hypothetical protein CVT62_13190 [Actinobacteria bacterium HGW-Actinobacteria-2]